MKSETTSFDRCPLRPITRCFTDHGIRPHLQHLEIVVRFEHQQIRAAQVKLDRVGHVTEIGHHANLHATRAKAEPHRIDRVVRNREAVDVDIADGERRPGLKAIQLGRELAPRNRRRRQPGDVDGNVQMPRQRNQTADMIGMLVRYQDRIQVFGLLADRGQPGQYVALAQARIDEDARPLSPDERCIPRTAAGQHTNLEDSSPPPRNCRLGQVRAACPA